MPYKYRTVPVTMKLLVITYEFTYSPFSGNGVLGRSLVKSLIRLDHTVDVLCCRPSDEQSNGSADRPLEAPEISTEQQRLLTVHAVPLDATRGWRTLDEHSAWQDFVLDQLQHPERLLAAANRADSILVVDWTGSHAYRSIVKKMDLKPIHTPMVYLNFRVYSSGIVDATKHAFYDKMEQRGLNDASVIVALSEKDQKTLRTMTSKTVHILVPPLRADIQELTEMDRESLKASLPAEARATVDENSAVDRCFVTCVARIGREKQVMRFVRFVEATPQLWTTSFAPLLAGASSDPVYADEVKRRLQAVQPKAVIVDHFLSPRQLAAVFSHSMVNFHPSSYDAFGMTIVESGAFCCPTILASNGDIGASKLVGEQGSIPVKFTEDAVSDDGIQIVEKVLLDREQVQAIGAVAKDRAFSWDESAYGRALLDLVPRN